MTGEAFTYSESYAWLWTGSTTASASALIAFAESTRGTFQKGFQNYQTLTGTYGDRLTGQRADVNIGALHHLDNAALRAMFDAGTAVHMHIFESSIGYSAGHFLWSGRIDTLDKAGQRGGIFTVQLSYHCNSWSAY